MDTLRQQARALVIKLRAHGRCYEMPDRPRCNRCEYCRQHQAAEIITQLLEKRPVEDTEQAEKPPVVKTDTIPPNPVVPLVEQAKKINPTLTKGLWLLYPYTSVYNDKPVDITKQQASLLYIIASARRPMTANELGHTLSSKGNAKDPSALFFVHYYRLKALLDKYKLEDPINKIEGTSQSLFQWNPNL